MATEGWGNSFDHQLPLKGVTQCISAVDLLLEYHISKGTGI